MRIGIVGMPNAGKSSLFNALTRAGADAANYPFTTVEPNVAVVPVKDERLDRSRATLGSTHRSPTRRSLPRHRGAGARRALRARGSATASWPTSARPTRSCTSCALTTTRSVVHPEGRVDPLRRHRDDRDRAALRGPGAGRAQAGAGRHAGALGRRAAVAEEAWLRELIAALAGGRAGRDRAAAGRRARRDASLQPLTAKPVLYVANVGEGDDEVPDSVASHAQRAGAAPWR